MGNPVGFPAESFMTDYCMKLVDKAAYFQVLGSLMNNVELLSDINRPLTKRDFNTEPLYEILFVSINNLYLSGVKVIEELVLDQYITAKKDWVEYYKDNGLDYVADCRSMAELENYDYWYHRLRKFSLLRYYEERNIDTRFIYDADKADSDVEEQLKIDNLTEQEIIGMIEDIAVVKPNMEYCTNTISVNTMAGTGLRDLVEEFMRIPDFGLPFNSPALTTLARGARLGAVALLGGSSGSGKSRTLASYACRIAVSHRYSRHDKKWIHTGISEPTVFITTEMTDNEVRTIFLSFVSGVDENKVKMGGPYTDEEKERVDLAITYIEESPLHICFIPDFSIQDIKNIIKQYHFEHGVNYFFFDYIFATLRLMTEIKKTSGINLATHEKLLLFISELKAVAQMYNVFIYTAIQLNGEALNSSTIKDAQVLAGAKSVQNKVDIASNNIIPSKSDLKKIDSILKNAIGMPTPNLIQWVYKLRSGIMTRVIIWSYVSMGCMEQRDLFVTDFNFELIDLDFTEVVSEEEVESVIKENSVPISEYKTQEMIDVENNEEDEDEEVPKRGFDW